MAALLYCNNTTSSRSSGKRRPYYCCSSSANTAAATTIIGRSVSSFAFAVAILLLVTTTTTTTTNSVVVQAWTTTTTTTVLSPRANNILSPTTRRIIIRRKSTRRPYRPSRRRRMVMAQLMMAKKASSSSEQSSTSSDDSVQDLDPNAALGIVPPDKAWDTIQRARYVANDKSYTRWPPCIRLFHPFLSNYCQKQESIISRQQQEKHDDSAGDENESNDNTENDDMALRIANIIEKHNIEPFEVRLNRWSVISHNEMLYADLQALKQSPQRSAAGKKNDDENEVDSSPLPPGFLGPGGTVTKEDLERQRQVDDLIAYHEEEGRRNKLKREARRKMRMREEAKSRKLTSAQPEDDTGSEHDDNNNNNNENDDDDSPRSLLEKQKRMYEEYNGPTVVVLEPDEESKLRLQQVRQIIHDELFNTKEDEGSAISVSQSYSPSLSVTPPSLIAFQGVAPPLSDNDNDDEDNDEFTNYRPIVPIAAFPTTTSAIAMARKLSKLWVPLTFNVTDLHMISCLEQQKRPAGNNAASAGTGSTTGSTTVVNNYWWQEEQERYLEESTLDSYSQFGCDALIMLMGQEIQVDPELAQEMAQMVYEKGEDGGGASGGSGGASTISSTTGSEKGTSKSTTSSLLDELDLDANDGDVSDLQRWLDNVDEDDYDDEGVDSNSLGGVFDDDDDEDDGTVVVIGRTHFFTGQQRLYVGMPATSVTDAKDRVPRGNSAVARRRGAVHRTSTRRGRNRVDMEWGRVENDYSPWTPRERRMGRGDIFDKIEERQGRNRKDQQ